MTQEELIQEIAKVVIRGNFKNYKEMCKDTGEEENTETFKTFCVTDETVLAYMKWLSDKVHQEVEIQQAYIAEVLYQ